jgi:hypothetical protein
VADAVGVASGAYLCNAIHPPLGAKAKRRTFGASIFAPVSRLTTATLF